jgi:hypothetical protein
MPYRRHASAPRRPAADDDRTATPSPRHASASPRRPPTMTERLLVARSAPMTTPSPRHAYASPSPSHKSRATARGSRRHMLVYIEGWVDRTNTAHSSPCLSLKEYRQLEVASWNQTSYYSIGTACEEPAGSKCVQLIEEYNRV